MDYKALYEQLQMAEIEKIQEYMDWKRDGEGSLYKFIKTYLGHNDALEEDAFNERELRFAAEAENKKLKRQLSDPYGGNQTCAELLQNYRDEMNIIEKIDEGLEDISLVAPYIKRLKDENEKLRKWKDSIFRVRVDSKQNVPS